MVLASLRSAYEALESSMTRHEAVAAAIESAIRDGVINAGARLPTVRALSAELHVSASTVLAAYGLLSTRGRVAGEVGRGTFVLADPGPDPIRQLAQGTSHWKTSTTEQRPPWRRRTVVTTAARLHSAYPAALDCTRGKPDTEMLLTRQVKRAFALAAADITADGLQYATPSPLPVLRECLLPRLLADGVPAARNEMIIGTSAQQLMVLSLSIAARLMPDRPHIVAVEEPGYQTVFDAFEYQGFRLMGLATDEHGVLPGSLAAALDRGAITVLFTPRALNPTGASWTRQRRQELAEVMRQHPHVIAIEDDQLADLAGSRPGSLLDDAGLENRVIYIRTFAKSLAPDLRVAVAVAAPRLATILAEVKSLSDGWTSQISQCALAHLLRDPDLDQGLDAARQAYRRRRETVTGRLHDGLGHTGAHISGGDGLNIWINLPLGITASEVIDRAAHLGVLLASGEPFYIRPGHNDVIRMSISGIRDEDAMLAADRVIEAVQTSIGSVAMAIPV